MQFYDRFAQLCAEKGVSVRKACLDMGYSQSLAAKWKHDDGMPNATTLANIAKYFGKTTAELLDEPTWLDLHATDNPKDPTLKQIVGYLSGLSEEDMKKLRDIIDTLL